MLSYSILYSAAWGKKVLRMIYFPKHLGRFSLSENHDYFTEKTRLELVIKMNAIFVCVLSHFSHFQLCNPMDCSLSPLSMRFSRQEYWSGLPFPFPGDIPDPEMKPSSLMTPALVGRFLTTSAIWQTWTWYLPEVYCMLLTLQPNLSPEKSVCRSRSNS